MMHAGHELYFDTDAKVGPLAELALDLASSLPTFEQAAPGVGEGAKIIIKALWRSPTMNAVRETLLSNIRAREAMIARTRETEEYRQYCRNVKAVLAGWLEKHVEMAEVEA